MSYTTVDHVRHHLAASAVPQARVTDQPLVLTGVEPISFCSGAVDSASLCVKTIASHDLMQSQVTLTSGATIISAAPLVRGSVVAASDSSLGHIYVENCDYLIDYEHATLQIKAGGDLTAGQRVTVWSLPFTVCRLGVDYQLDAERGEVRRLAGGDLASGQLVYLDYTPLHTSINDEILTFAVAQANALIERAVDPDRNFGADPTLASAATSRALEIICRTAAARDLGLLSSGDKTALVWLKLADSHAAQAELMLRNFRPPAIPPARPRLT